MASKIKLEIVAPDKLFFDGECDMLIIRTITGDMAVLHNHEPYVGIVDISNFRIVDNGEKKIGCISGGFLRVDKEKVTVIASSVEWQEDIDTARAEAAKERAVERLERKNSDEIDVLRAELALKRALNRLKTHSMND